MKSKILIPFFIISSFITIAGCETAPNISKTNRDFYHHNNGNAFPMVRKMDDRLLAKENNIPNNHNYVETYPTNQVTHFVGTIGSFTLSDARTGQIIKQGRAYNAPEGLYVIDNNGQRTNNIITSQYGTSLIFLPDIK